MITVLLAYTDETKDKALKQGFTAQTVLVKYSSRTKKKELESEGFALRPLQFLVADYWGASND